MLENGLENALANTRINKKKAMNAKQIKRRQKQRKKNAREMRRPKMEQKLVKDCIMYAYVETVRCKFAAPRVSWPRNTALGGRGHYHDRPEMMLMFLFVS